MNTTLLVSLFGLAFLAGMMVMAFLLTWAQAKDAERAAAEDARFDEDPDDYAAYDGGLSLAEHTAQAIAMVERPIIEGPEAGGLR